MSAYCSPAVLGVIGKNIRLDKLPAMVVSKAVMWGGECILTIDDDLSVACWCPNIPRTERMMDDDSVVEYYDLDHVVNRKTGAPAPASAVERKQMVMEHIRQDVEARLEKIANGKPS